jgi:hypothetical protein
MGVGRPDCYLLKLFGAHVHQAFGHVPYHVGSSLTEKRGWRDVDVRLLLPDDEYATYFGDWALPPEPGYGGPRRIMWELAWSTLGRKMTGLPIDFQIQPETLANEQFDGPRSALRLLSSDIPVALDSHAPREKRKDADG